MKKLFALAMITALSAMIFLGCEPDEPVNPIVTPLPVVPKVSTIEVMPITAIKVSILCKLDDDGYKNKDAVIDEVGICWALDTVTPTEKGLKKMAYNVKEGEIFSIEMDLSYGKKYNFRAYAKNTAGVALGEIKSFTTENLPPPEPRLADISEGLLLSRTSNSAYFSATVIDSGYCLINEIGVCWSKTGIPDINDHRQAISSNKVGEFTVSASVLDKLTDYNARVYVTNLVGTNYGDLIQFYTYDSVVDADGNHYYGVRIGNQVWLTENLKTTHFNNGDAIRYVTDNNEWAANSQSAYCWYDNDPTRADKGFGALYNQKAVLDPRGIAPEGYRVPTKEDAMEFGDHFGLEQYVPDPQGNPFQYIYKGGTSIRSNKYWAPLLKGNNSSGFSAIPSGSRSSDGLFAAGSYRATWWTTTVMDVSYYWTFYTGGEVANDHIYVGGNPTTYGRAIRCVKEN